MLGRTSQLVLALHRKARPLAMPVPSVPPLLRPLPSCARLWLHRPLRRELSSNAPSELRLIGEDGKPIGIVSHAAAAAVAAERKLALKEVSPKASPPVWRLVPDVPKTTAAAKADAKGAKAPGGDAKVSDARMAMKKRQRLSKAPKTKEGAAPTAWGRSGSQGLDGLEEKLSPTGQEHDFQVKMKNALQFLQKGNVVKVVAMATNRPENPSRRGEAEKLVGRFIEQCEELATSNGKTGKGQFVTTVLTPK